MKQAITQKQFDDLTPKQREAYIAWTMKKIEETGDLGEVYRSLGHLLWFLGEYMEDVQKWWGLYKDPQPVGWSFEAPDNARLGVKEQPELIDVLWEAVKLVLWKMTR